MSRRSRGRKLLVVTMLAAGAMPISAQTAAGPTRAGEIPIETYRLDNGLRVILSPDRSTPVVTVDVWYDVGSRDERAGRTGFAHLFEHMMFQGSENVGKAEHLNLVQRAGGNLNGSTSEDRTNYYQTLPSNRLNLGLWLEADRMRSLAVTAENLKNQQEVVKEERRMRVDNQPYSNAFLTAAYNGTYNPATCFAYAHNVIGSMDDLNAATLQDVQQFFKTYYAPNNATLTVVGDFDVAQAKRMIQEYFGNIPRGPAKPEVQCTGPWAKLPARTVVPDNNARLPAFIATYGAVPVGHSDSYALSLLGSILSSGETSRFNQRLVKQEQAAVQASASYDDRRGPGIFQAIAIANQGVGVERLEQLLNEEIAKVQQDGVRATELDRVKSRYRASTILGRQTTFGRAEALQYFAHFYGDPATINTDLARYMAVTPADIQRVARTYLVPNRRAVVIAQPAGQQTPNPTTSR